MRIVREMKERKKNEEKRRNSCPCPYNKDLFDSEASFFIIY
jgi:hypothetical protein